MAQRRVIFKRIYPRTGHGRTNAGWSCAPPYRYRRQYRRNHRSSAKTHSWSVSQRDRYPKHRWVRLELSISTIINPYNTQETVEDTGSESASGDVDKTVKRRRRYLQKRRSVVNPDENFYFYWLMMLTICVLYNLWTLIVRQSFPELQVSYSAHLSNKGHRRDALP